MMAGSISLGPDISPAGRGDISPGNYNYFFCNSPVKYRCTTLERKQIETERKQREKTERKQREKTERENREKTERKQREKQGCAISPPKVAIFHRGCHFPRLFLSEIKIFEVK